MAKEIIGYTCKVQMNMPVKTGEPANNPVEYITPAGQMTVVIQEVATERQKIASQVCNMFAKNYVPDQGDSPFSHSVTVEPVFADINQPPFSNKP
jgi:hypothetical protein